MGFHFLQLIYKIVSGGFSAKAGGTGLPEKSGIVPS
jgi:hypothetical protein